MDETTTQAQEPVTESVADQPSDTPPTGNSEKLLPQSEVNRLIANARREGRESALKAAKPAATPAPAPAPQAASAAPASDALTAMQARLEEMELRLRFEPAAAKLGWDDTQSATMFDLFKAQKPSDSTDWFSRMEQLFPGSRKQATAPATPTQDNKPAPAPAPAPTPQKPTTNISDLGPAASSNARDSEGIALSRPREVTQHDLDALVAKHGYAKAMFMWSDAITRELRGMKIAPENRRQR